jgi:two-component system, NtrC family, sensor histidine kinase HydH
MPNGGTLTLQTRSLCDEVELDVIDTGTGIAPDVLAKLFKPFQTTKPNGNGLGLATARRIVIAHGGEMTVASTVGHGTKFTIRLPIAPLASEAKPRDNPDA